VAQAADVWLERFVTNSTTTIRPLTITGNQTGASQGTGMRNRTSVSRKLAGHLTSTHKPA
jgi:hypothetical protein